MRISNLNRNRRRVVDEIGTSPLASKRSECPGFRQTSTSTADKRSWVCRRRAAHDEGGRIAPRAGSTSQDDPFHDGSCALAVCRPAPERGWIRNTDQPRTAYLWRGAMVMYFCKAWRFSTVRGKHGGYRDGRSGLRPSPLAMRVAFL